MELTKTRIIVKFDGSQEGLEPINLLVEDSYAIPHYKILQEHFWKYGATLQVCPDFL